MRFVTSAALALSLSLLASAALAQGGGGAKQPQIGVTVDREPLVQGEPFELTITIATESGDEPEIRLPPLTGVRVLRQFESHPMSFSFSFGMGGKAVRQSKRQSEYTFVAVADRPGRFTVNPIEVKVDGTRFRSQSYAFNVVGAGGGTGGSSGNSPQPDPGAVADPAPQPDPVPTPGSVPVDLEGAQIDSDYFVHAVVSKKRCGVGEMIVLRVYLYTSWSVSSIQLLREPGTDGFWVENLDTGSRPGSLQEQVQIGDRVYERAELRRVALFPVRSGKLTIAPPLAELEVRRGGFFSRAKTVRRAAAPIVVEVDPLPEEGRPAGFDPANVGSFSFRAEMDRSSAKVGEPVTLTMTLRGSGNVRNAVLPQIPEIDGLKVYAPENEIDVVAREESVTGTLTSKVMMIPKRAGTFVVPKIEWSYFDVAAHAYKTLTSEPKTIEVAQGEGTAALPTDAPSLAKAPSGDGDGSAFARMTQKLRSISSRTDTSTADAGRVFESPWFLFIVVLAPLGYAGLVFVQVTRRKRREGFAKDRSKRAGSDARHALEKLARSSDSQSDVFYAELQRILRTFLENRLEEPVAGDTMAELLARLKRRGFEDDLAAAAVAEMESCDFARFARSATAEKDRSQALDGMRALLDRLEAVRVVKKEAKP